MEVVLLGSVGVGVHAIGRALGRALDATVVDGDRLRHRICGSEDPEPPEGMAPDWLGALDLALPQARPRPHVVATCTSLSPDERLALRRDRVLLVLLRQASATEPALEPPDEHDEHDEHTVVAEVDGRVEEAAARLLGRLVPRLHATSTGAPGQGASPAPGDDVCSGRG